MFQLITFLAALMLSDDSPLVLAARSGDTASIRALVAGGADPNKVVAGNTEWTPLMHAIHKEQLASVAALLEAGADPNRSNPDGMTPLMMAAGYGYTAMVELLLQRGARPNQAEHSGQTALDYALAGANDIDRFTLFSCQDKTVRAILRAAPRMRGHAHAWSLRFAKWKGCEGATLAQ